MRANQSIAFSRPCHCCLNRIREIQVFQPRFLTLCELAVGNLNGQLVRPLQRKRIGLPTHATEPLLRDGAIPHMVQVVVPPIPLHVNTVAAPSDILIMQRLVQVADKVDDKLGSLRTQPCRQLGIERLAGVVCQRADDAAILLAVALEVDVARLGRVVVGVDEVEVLGEAAPSRVADRVGPSGNVGEVFGFVAAQELLEVGLGRVGDKVAGEVGCCDVPKTWKWWLIS